MPIPKNHPKNPFTAAFEPFKEFPDEEEARTSSFGRVVGSIQNVRKLLEADDIVLPKKLDILYACACGDSVKPEADDNKRTTAHDAPTSEKIGNALLVFYFRGSPEGLKDFFLQYNLEFTYCVQKNPFTSAHTPFNGLDTLTMHTSCFGMATGSFQNIRKFLQAEDIVLPAGVKILYVSSLVNVDHEILYDGRESAAAYVTPSYDMVLKSSANLTFNFRGPWDGLKALFDKHDLELLYCETPLGKRKDYSDPSKYPENHSSNSDSGGKGECGERCDCCGRYVSRLVISHHHF